MGIESQIGSSHENDVMGPVMSQREESKLTHLESITFLEKSTLILLFCFLFDLFDDEILLSAMAPAALSVCILPVTGKYL